MDTNKQNNNAQPANQHPSLFKGIDMKKLDAELDKLVRTETVTLEYSDGTTETVTLEAMKTPTNKQEHDAVLAASPEMKKIFDTLESMFGPLEW